MPPVDLSFASYVAARKGANSARVREGGYYAYGADRRVRSVLDSLRPVTLAVEATLRFWQSVGRNSLLSSAVRVGPKQFPRIHALAERCAERLQLPGPTVYVSPAATLAERGAQTFGSMDDATIILYSALTDQFSDDELTFVIGRECGHIQNNHTIYLTTLYYLSDAANMIVRYGAQPAVIALNSWSRRAEITCDRAGLLCVRDLDIATAVLVKLAIGSQSLYRDVNVQEYLQQLEETRLGPGRFGELFARHPYLPRRVQALRLFAETAFYRSLMDQGSGGLTKEECDVKVGELLSVIG